MKRYAYSSFNDPKDLNNWSSIAFRLMAQCELIDYARRCFQRAGDETSLKKSEELKKFMRQILQLQTEAIGALIPTDMIMKLWKVKDL